MANVGGRPLAFATALTTFAWALTAAKMWPKPPRRMGM